MLCATVALTGCGAADEDSAVDAAEGFYAAQAQQDGKTACGLLSQSTRTRLERDESEPCEQAVLGLELTGERAVGSDAYVTEAKVDLDGGDSVFLEDTADGWRVSAAGCKPVPDQEAPYECEVES